jgi:peptidoglycan/xylan/chitin deacetylase (PgdA/CDA1 family)
MEKKAGTKSTNQKSVINFKLIGLCAILLIISLFVVYKIQTRPVVESLKSEQKKIPPDVKSTMATNSNLVNNPTTFRVPIFMYHYIEYVQDKNDKIRQSLNINPNTFEKQLQTLTDAGYNFLTARELGDIIDGKAQMPKNPILLTFDDGHWDFDTVVIPILKKYHIKATAYIIPGFTGGSDFMTISQVQDALDSGLVDIGAHTVHHISLKGKLSPIVTNEVTQSKLMLESTYHISVVSFAYPNGSFDQQAINAVKNAGFTTAVSTIPGIMQGEQNKFFLYRLRPGYRTGKTLLDYLQQTTFKQY